MLVVCDARAIGRPNFAQDCSALRHYFGNAETVADFDQFPPRDNYFAVACKRGKHHQDRRGAIVDHDRIFCACQARQQFSRMHIALAARAAFQVVFQIGIMRRGPAQLFEYSRRKRRAPQIRVQNHARGVDHRLQRVR